MKTFNDLLNESEGVRLTNDYTKYLLEKQYALTKETASILLEESDDDDAGSRGEPFNRVYKGNKIFVHLDVDGKRLIKVVDSKQEAAILAQKYPAMAYSGDGELLRLNEKTELPGLQSKMPKTYEILRKQYEAEIKKNIQAEKEFRQKSNLPFDEVAARENAKWKAVYDNPILADVLSAEEYETQGMKTQSPLYIQKTGERYIPRSEFGEDEIQKFQELNKQIAQAEKDKKELSPDALKGVPDVRFAAPSHISYSDLPALQRMGMSAKDWASKPENIKQGIATSILGGMALRGLFALGGKVAQATGLSKYLPTLSPATQVGVGVSIPVVQGAYEFRKGVEQRSKAAEVGQVSDVVAPVAGEVLSSTAATLAPILPYEIGTRGALGLRRRGTAVKTEPIPTIDRQQIKGLLPPPPPEPIAIKTTEPFKVSGPPKWLDSDAEIRAAIKGFETMTAKEQQAALQASADALTGWKTDPYRLLGQPRPGMPGSRVRTVGGSSERVSPYNLTPKERASIERAGTDVERDIVQRAANKRLGKAIGGSVGERLSQSDSPIVKDIVNKWNELRQSAGIDPTQPPSAEELQAFRRSLGVSGEFPPPRQVKPVEPISLEYPSLPPMAPREYRTFDDYKHAKEKAMDRELTPEEIASAETEYELSVTEKIPSDISTSQHPSSAEQTFAKVLQSKTVKAAADVAAIPGVADTVAIPPSPPPIIGQATVTASSVAKPTQNPIELTYTTSTPAKPNTVTSRSTVPPKPVATTATQPAVVSPTINPTLDPMRLPIAPPTKSAVPTLDLMRLPVAPPTKSVVPPVDPMSLPVAPPTRSIVPSEGPKDLVPPASKELAPVTSKELVPTKNQITAPASTSALALAKALAVARSTAKATPPAKVPPRTPTKPRISPVPPGAAIPPFGGDTESGSTPSEGTAAQVERLEDWNLRLREIYGKLAGTLTK